MGLPSVTPGPTPPYLYRVPVQSINAVHSRQMVVNIFTKQIRQQEDETGRGHTPNSLHGVISPRNEELPQLRDYPSAKYELF